MIKKYVVTGGEGFVGTYICKALQLHGHEVHSVDYRPNLKERVAGVNYHDVDIRDGEKMREISKGADAVFHIAGLPRAADSLEDPSGTLSVNVLGTRSVLDAAVNAGVRRVVFASSSAIYGEQAVLPLQEEMFPLPLSPYGFQKYLSEKLMKDYAQDRGLTTVSLRFFNVYGYWSDLTSTGSLAITRFLSYRAEDKPLTIYGDGTQTRDFVHVKDVADACINAADNESVGNGEIINIASGQSTNLLTIAELIGGQIEHVTGPAGEIHDSCADITRAKELLGWAPKIDFKEGMDDLKRNWGLA